MDVRNSLEGLKTILGVSQPTTAATPGKSNNSLSGSSAMGADQATLSSAGSAVSTTLGDSSVRADKVASIQAALAAGTYNVPASALASKLVESMLGAQ